jgi:hypothetical protein
VQDVLEVLYAERLNFLIRDDSALYSSRSARVLDGRDDVLS